MCHECKIMPLAEKRASLFNAIEDNEISCCFYQFRKLRSVKLGGNFSVAGYLDPQRDPLESQISIWRDSVSLPPFQDVYKAKFILGLIGTFFQNCSVANLTEFSFFIFQVINSAIWLQLNENAYLCTLKWRKIRRSFGNQPSKVFEKFVMFAERLSLIIIGFVDDAGFSFVWIAIKYVNSQCCQLWLHYPKSRELFSKMAKS